MQRQWADAPSVDEFKDASKNTTTVPRTGHDDPMPFLLLQGYWLRDLGFHHGAKIRVEASKGRVTARVIGPVNSTSTAIYVFEGEVQYPESIAEAFAQSAQRGTP